jgi:branched-chain amino acid transport system substrate-binding protein
VRCNRFGRSHERLTFLPLLLVALLLLLAAACGGGDEVTIPELTDEPRSSADEAIVVPAGAPIVIGVSVPLTGPDEDAGLEDRDAVLTAIDRWKAANGELLHGHEIVVRAEDDGCTEEDIAAQAAERLLRQPGLAGVIGPDCSAGAASANPVYAKAGIVAISGSATRTDLTEEQPEGGYFFRTAYRNDLEGLLIALATAEDFGNILLVDDGESYGQDLADSSTQLLEDAGISVERETIERGAVDYSEIASQIAQANPELVGFVGFNPEAALFYEQLRDAGYEGPFGASDAAASVTDFVDPVGAEEAEGVVFVGCALTLPADFLAAFEVIHGEQPAASPFVAQYADAATVLLNALATTAEAQQDGSLSIDPQKLRDAVASTDLPDGLSGPIAFDADGDRVPTKGDELEQVVAEAAAAQDASLFQTLGLVPCFVQGGRLVNAPAG